MFTVPLSPIPNQRCSIRLEASLFELALKVATSLMTVTITRDGQNIVQGVRCLPGIPLIPFRYLEGLTGNFYFFTEGNVYPHYSRFGATDILYYLTADELMEIRNG